MLRDFIKLPIVLVLLMMLLMKGVDALSAWTRFEFALRGVISVVSFLGGMAIILVGGYHFRRVGTTVDPRHPAQASSLVTGGIYRLSRNPMYVGFFLWLLAAALYIGNALNLALLPLFVVLVNRLFIAPEEAALDRLFGQAFAEYKNRVRRWL